MISHFSGSSVLQFISSFITSSKVHHQFISSSIHQVISSSVHQFIASSSVYQFIISAVQQFSSSTIAHQIITHQFIDSSVNHQLISSYHIVWWWTGTNSQSSTPRALTWIQCRLGKQYLEKNLHCPANRTQDLLQSGEMRQPL